MREVDGRSGGVRRSSLRLVGSFLGKRERRPGRRREGEETQRTEKQRIKYLE